MNVAIDAVPKSNSSQFLSKVERVMRSRPAWDLPSHRSILPGWHGHSCPPKSCPLCARSQRRSSCKILSSRDRFHPQADSPRLTRLSLAAAPHRCTAPRSAPSAPPAASSKKTPPDPKKFKFLNFLDRRGTTPSAAASKCPGRRFLLALSSQ